MNNLKTHLAIALLVDHDFKEEAQILSDNVFKKTTLVEKRGEKYNELVELLDNHGINYNLFIRKMNMEYMSVDMISSVCNLPWDDAKELFDRYNEWVS